MQPLTEVELKQFAPSAKAHYVDALLHNWPEMQRRGINTPLRLCNFLAQLAHESGGFTIVRENTNWSPKRMCEIWPGRYKTPMDPRILLCGSDPVKKANLAYSHRADIGNQGGNDGWDFRGCGPMQDTGRYAFREAGSILGMDLETEPEVYENIHLSMKVAVVKWERMGLNILADRHYIRAIGNKINRGSAYSKYEPIGHASRLKWFSKAWTLFGDTPQPEVPEGMALGAYGASVEALQGRLRELGYGVGSVDGVFGPATARAVAAFKYDHKRHTGEVLETDEVAGPETLAALDIAPPVELSPERTETTEAELVAESSTARAGKDVEVAGTVLAGSGAAAAAADNGIFDGMSTYLGWMPEVQSVLTPVASAAMWGVKNALWLLPLLGGIWFWQRGRHVVVARLKDHWSGLNLSR